MTAALTAVGGIAWSGTTAQAISAVYVPSSTPGGIQGTIEVQGFAGRFTLPETIASLPASNPAVFADVVAGATATDATLYTLLNPSRTAGNSVVVKNDAHTGAYLGTVQLATEVTDLAYTDGQLYGIVPVAAVTAPTPTSPGFRIVSIAANGTTQSVHAGTTSLPSYTPAVNWRLSGAANGNSLLAVAPAYPASPAYVVTPSGPQPTATTFALPSVYPGRQVTDTVIHADGAGFTFVGGGSTTQADYTYPAGATVGSRAVGTAYSVPQTGAGPSDEFDYAYPAGQAATATFTTVESQPFQGTDLLFRQPQVISATRTLYLVNGVAPDGVSLGNVALSAGSVYQAYGPSPITIQEQMPAPGSFGYRPVDTFTFSLNLATATRGAYAVYTKPQVTADYTVGDATQVGRPVAVPSTGAIAYFGYDPVSANVVGNGDASAGGDGWETIYPGGSVVHASAGYSSLGFSVTPTSSSSQSILQHLLEPTPTGAVRLSFEYDLIAFDPGKLTVLLGGVIVATVNVTSADPTMFQTLIDDPTLEGLSAADLEFTGSTATTSEIGIGNITLTAVPEPPIATTLAAIGTVAFTRRRRRRGTPPAVASGLPLLTPF